MNVHTLVLNANGLANHSLTQVAVVIIILCISEKSHFKAIYLYSSAKCLIFMYDKLKLPFVVAIGQHSISSKGTKVTTNSTSTCHTLLRVCSFREDVHY